MRTIARSVTLAAVVLLSASAVFTGAQNTKPVIPRGEPKAVIAGPESKAVPPITFADPDGQELILEELSVRTAIHGMLSLTELELRFRNPQERRIEGRFTATLPANAAISRFAKDVNGHLMEGEVVERLRANQVYEQFLHQMRDPALLEQDQGNRFSARIFPIEAKAPVHLVLSYTQLLPMRGGERTYALPLRGLPEIDRFSFRAFGTPIPGEGLRGKLTTSTAEVTSFDEEKWTPDRDIVMTWRASEDAPTRVLRAGDFYLAAIRPDVQAVGQRSVPANRWLFYVDTSASSAEGAPHRIRALEELLGALPPGDRVELIAFDQELAPLAKGTAAELSHSAGDLLEKRLFLGGTDVDALLRDVARKLGEDPSRAIVLASDLVPTLGRTSSNEIRDAIEALPRGTVHALILGSREDAATAKAITAGRGRVVRVPFSESLAARAREAAEALRRPLGGTFDVRDAGAEWVYPTHFDDVQPGDEVIALGKVKAGRDSELSASASRLDASTFAPLLEREAYRAYLEYLAEREANETNEGVRRALAAEQVKVSVEQRVVIPRTTMLVLESEWEYQRFGLDRRALAEILTIDAGGIGRIDRVAASAWAHAAPPPPPPPMPVTRDRRERAEAAKALPAPQAEASAPAPPAETSMSHFAFDATEEVALTDDAAGVEGGVVGGVAGGVVGGSVEGVTQAISVTAEAPSRSAERDDAPMRAGPAPMTRGRSLRVESKRADTVWTRRHAPSPERIAELEKQLRENPQDRELYNQLSETLAALGEWKELRALALRWQPYDPENPQVYEVLGNASAELGRESEAARAFASLIEIAPAKPELLQRAGLLLLRTRRASLAEAPLRRALELRPDRANAYRHLALMLWQEGRVEEAARVLESATRQPFPGWYRDVHRVIREELGLVYHAWMRKDGSRRREIEERAREHRVDLARRDALRVTLAWETDANDVDLHVVDPDGEEVFYSHQASRSGLELYEDVTQGLGPEVVRAPKAIAGTYHVGVRYFAAGPMGISRGVVIVTRGDEVEIHPFRLAKGGEEIRYVAGVRF